jgi:hypothetical protein
MDADRVMKITDLRDVLGWAYRDVVLTDMPITVQRYGHKDVMLLSKWEWEFFKQLEAEIKAGQCPIGRERGESCPRAQSK